MNRFRLLLLILMLLPAAANAEFWASSKAKRYHRASCRWVAQITPEFRIKFSTKDAAWSAGYRPCDICRPPGLAVETPPKPVNHKRPGAMPARR